MKNEITSGKKCKALPARSRGGPYGYETSRFPHFLDTRFIYSGRLSALRAGRPLRPRKIPVLISVRYWVDPRTTVRLEGLGQLKKPNDLVGNRTRDLPACGWRVLSSGMWSHEGYCIVLAEACRLCFESTIVSEKPAASIFRVEFCPKV
jgi:hypothetical protein